MNELDEIYLRSVSNETLGGDLTALNAVKWDRTEDQPDGTRIGFDDMTGQSFVLGKSDPPPAAPALRKASQGFLETLQAQWA